LDRSVEQRLTGARGALVGDVADIGQPGRVVDHDLEVVIPALPAMPVRRLHPTQQPMTAAVGDPAELLVVLVDE
jgi:hypothetical protein